MAAFDAQSPCELGWFGDLVGGQIAGFAACNKLLGNAVYQVT
jgi:hypothetical protein